MFVKQGHAAALHEGAEMLSLNLLEASSPRPSPPQVCGGGGEEARSNQRASPEESGRRAADAGFDRVSPPAVPQNMADICQEGGSRCNGLCVS